jgi:hypothetical protein
MTQCSHPYQDIATFVAEKMPDVLWVPRKHHIIYISPTERLNVTVERGTSEDGKYFGYGMYRHDILEQAGIHEAANDSENLAEAYFEKLFDYLSVRDMLAVRQRINKYIDNFNTRWVEQGLQPVGDENKTTRQNGAV